MKYILALDQGTTSCRASVFNRNGLLIGTCQKAFQQIYPKPDWVEHNAIEIYNSCLQVIHDVLHQHSIEPKEILCIGIANQRETFVLWDKHTGEPIYNAIVWQDRRSSQICQYINGKKDLAKYIKKNTGLTIDPYFTAPKLKWVLDNVKDARKKAEAGDLLFGTMDTWIIWNLTGGWVHATDYSNASRTMLFNIHTLDWDSKLLEDIEIPTAILPEVRTSVGSYDKTDEKIFGVEIPIAAVVGDHHASLFGQACIEEGMINNSYGSGAFVLMNTGSRIYESKNGLISTIAWGMDNTVEYALEGGVYIAGDALVWLGEKLHILDGSEDSEYFAGKVLSSNGLYFVPAFSGLGAPYWDGSATGAIFGIRRDTTKAHIVRATLEAIAYRSKDVIDAMLQDTGIVQRDIRADGSMTKNNFLLQFQADILGYEVLRSENPENTGRGLAFMAGIQMGLWDKKEVAKSWKLRNTFKPKMTEERRSDLLKGWKKAVNRALNWSY